MRLLPMRHSVRFGLISFLATAVLMVSGQAAQAVPIVVSEVQGDYGINPQQIAINPPFGILLPAFDLVNGIATLVGVPAPITGLPASSMNVNVDQFGPATVQLSPQFVIDTNGEGGFLTFNVLNPGTISAGPLSGTITVPVLLASNTDPEVEASALLTGILTIEYSGIFVDPSDFIIFLAAGLKSGS